MARTTTMLLALAGLFALVPVRAVADNPPAFTKLPPSLQPEPFRFTLTVVDRPEADAFTVGGGYVCVTQPLLDALLADRQRGPSALAFALAREIGHIARQHCRRGYQRLQLQEEVKK